MKMVFGLFFTNDSGEKMQFTVNTETGEVKINVTQGGQWQGWQRIDVKRKASGELDETVFQAKRAETADHFSTPIAISFDGAATGQLQFDGSVKTVGVSLGVGHATHSAISSAISAHVDQHHSYSGGGDSGDYGGGGGG